MENVILEWFDLPVLHGIAQQMQCPVLDRVMPWITHLGFGNLTGIGMALVLVLFKRTRNLGKMLALAFLLGFICCNLTLKPLIDRVRPFDYFADVLHQPDIRMQLLISPPRDGSFPSGHAVFAFIWASVLWKRARRPWGYVVAGMAILIAFSRVYLWVHWPTDVIAGAGLGILCGTAGVRLINHLSERDRSAGSVTENNLNGS